MQARYYDPSLGRFASEDPGRQGSNWFVYCHNSPNNLVDETGKVSGVHKFWDGVALVSAILAAVSIFLALPEILGVAGTAAILVLPTALLCSVKFAFGLAMACGGMAAFVGGVVLALAIITAVAIYMASEEIGDGGDAEPKASPAAG